MSEHNSSTGAGSRAALYFRMSTDKQEDSIERQRGGVLPYAKARGYRLAGEYADEGVAGDEFGKRSGFQQLLRDAAAGRFDVILVDEPSRLSRQSPVELIEKVIAPLSRAGVRLDTASKGPLDYDSLAGLIMMTVHSHKAEDESRDLSRRVLGGMADRARRGAYFGWVAPFGLRVLRDVDQATGKVLARRLVLGPEEEVRAVRFIFDAVANRGWSLRRTCRELEARGVKPPAGNGRGANKARGGWNAVTVRKILRNRKYVGDLPWNETHRGKYSYLAGGAVGKHERKNTRYRRNAAADVIVCADHPGVPALIDRDTFARAAAALAGMKKCTSPAADGNRYLFTRLLVCGDCGAFLRGLPYHGRKAYVCSRYKDYGARACSRNCVEEADVWAAVLGALKDEVLSPARLDEVEAEMDRRLEEERAGGEADRLRARLAALARDIDRGNANLARLPADVLAGVVAKVREWGEERGRLQGRLRELEGGASTSKAVLDEARKQLWRLREALEGGDVEAQAVVAREVLSKVEVRFEKRTSHGRRSASGRGRASSVPVGLVLNVRPGLGLSCLFTTAGRSTAPAPGRTASRRRRRAAPGVSPRGPAPSAAPARAPSRPAPPAAPPPAAAGRS
jgi:DNA invertase Pin-like site-specific DNA recombinase